MKGEFIIILNGELKTYNNYEDIPDIFDNIIKFMPEWPEPPHSDEEHEYIATFPQKLKELMERETNK